ncbi:MAG: DUF4147 domain-containing protein [Rhodobacteraceae bacterium]|nr:DUF4147 domain-containing protein [Paracoccaceae bacterium]
MTLSEMRALARSVFDAGVVAADPYDAVKAALTRKSVPKGTPIVAVGKAAVRMAEAALECSDAPGAVLVVTNPENARDIAGARVFASAHPVPDEVGLDAGLAVEELLRDAQQDVLALISGGGSALLPAPAAGLTLADKAAVSEALLASGAEITEMNLVRQCLSRLKGGGMLRAAAPAKVRALILSDVVGDDLRAIASGPTAAPLGSPAEAKAICESYGIWSQLPSSVQEVLSRPSITGDTPEAENELVGSNTQSVMAMAGAAKAAGMPLHIHSPALTGDVEDAARRVAGTTDVGIHLFGGETTVQLQGTGKGGRNQELALRVALHLEKSRRTWVYLQGGTDGRDGPTDAAGGVVDAEIIAQLRARTDVEAGLLNNDAYPVLKAGGGLLMTGGTGTNVADLGILIVA